MLHIFIHKCTIRMLAFDNGQAEILQVLIVHIVSVVIPFPFVLLTILPAQGTVSHNCATITCPKLIPSFRLYLSPGSKDQQDRAQQDQACLYPYDIWAGDGAVRRKSQ